MADISLFDTQESIPEEIPLMLLQSIIAGFEDYQKNVTDSSKAICCPTTKANFINDHMVFHAIEKLNGHPNVRFIKRHARTHLMISERFELKLKKLNRNRRPSNILTQAVFAFHNQIPPEPPYQLEFSDMLDPITNLIAGYQQNKLKTGIEAVYIVCPKGTHNKWEWKIDFVEEFTPKTTQTFAPDIPDMPKVKTVKPKASFQKRGARL